MISGSRAAPMVVLYANKITDFQRNPYFFQDGRMSEKPLILVLGASGYVGTRLVRTLVQRGWRVRAAGRSTEKLKRHAWYGDPGIEVRAVDVLDRSGLEAACRGVSAVYYLVHSMEAGRADFSETERLSAENMRDAAAAAGVDRIIYLGGLGEENEDLSPHLKSRRATEKILQSGRVPVTVLRAAMIIGSGSASFEILRYLVERLPAMVTPRWVSTESQPIAIGDVLGYLAGCLEKKETSGRIFEIGGAEILTYRRLMEIYAEEAGLRKRFVIPVPVLTPRLSSYWIHLVTPIHAAIARPLALGLRNRVVCNEQSIRAIVPLPLHGAREAIRLALDQRQHFLRDPADIESLQPEWVWPGDPSWAGGTVFTDRRVLETEATPAQIWKTLASIGGKNGWYHANWLWKLRGFLDRLAGGVGMRRGRRHETEIRNADTIDFWRVERADPERRLLLAAEMKLPGPAVLDFVIEPRAGGARLIQTARFIPRGLSGILYWFAVSPFHHYVFRGMIRGIVRRSLLDPGPVNA